jgi:DNA-directed RNA polymerase delta subunit
MFLKALSRKPKTLEEICKEIARDFIDVSPADIADDVFEFYSVLERDGFIVSGETEAELDKKDSPKTLVFWDFLYR